jgi:hypothetical protein
VANDYFSKKFKIFRLIELTRIGEANVKRHMNSSVPTASIPSVVSFDIDDTLDEFVNNTMINLPQIQIVNLIF